LDITSPHIHIYHSYSLHSYSVTRGCAAGYAPLPPLTCRMPLPRATAVGYAGSAIHSPHHLLAAHRRLAPLTCSRQHGTSLPGLRSACASYPYLPATVLHCVHLCSRSYLIALFSSCLTVFCNAAYSPRASGVPRYRCCADSAFIPRSPDLAPNAWIAVRIVYTCVLPRILLPRLYRARLLPPRMALLPLISCWITPRHYRTAVPQQLLWTRQDAHLHRI